MRKIAFFVAVVLNCPVLFSQSSNHSFGIELSPTAVSFLGDLYRSNQEFKVGYSAGFTYRYRLNNFLSVKSGISLDHKGTKTEVLLMDEFQEFIGTMGFSINYSYLVVPIMAALNDKKDHFYISSGPFIGYLLSAITRNDAYNEFPAAKTNSTKNAEKLDFGWVFNIGYGFKLSDKFRFELGIREDLGIKNLAEGGAVLRTNAIGFRVGLIIL